MTPPSLLAPKPVSASAIDQHFYKVFPEDLNASNTLFGGKIMAILDLVASIVAERHTHNTCVTAAVDSIHFLHPAKQGDVLLCQASVNRAWRTSMEIGVRVFTNNYKLDYSHHLVSAYFTFVAVDEHRNPIPVPPIVPETDTQWCRYQEAEHRRLYRQQAVSRKVAENKPVAQKTKSHES